MVSELTADFDGNGNVDGDDLTHPTLDWESRYGADLSGADFLAWQQQNLGVEGLTASRAVPEPIAVALVLPLVLAISCLRLPNRA